MKTYRASYGATTWSIQRPSYVVSSVVLVRYRLILGYSKPWRISFLRTIRCRFSFWRTGYRLGWALSCSMLKPKPNGVNYRGGYVQEILSLRCSID